MAVVRRCPAAETGTQGAEVMSRTELLYVVSPAAEGWVVLCETLAYGPFQTFHDAFESAVEEAHAAGEVGFSSMVLVSGEDLRPRVRWTYGRDPYLPAACGRA